MGKQQLDRNLVLTFKTVKELTVSLLIAMPYSRDASDGESGDNSFGTAVYPWYSQWPEDT